MPPNFASTPIHQTRSGVWGEERTDTIWQFIEQFSMESTPLISKIYQLTMLIFQIANFFYNQRVHFQLHVVMSIYYLMVIWWFLASRALFDSKDMACHMETGCRNSSVRCWHPNLGSPAVSYLFFGGKQLNHVESPQNHIQSYSYLLILNHIIFILYSSYIHIVFILYSYNIQIIFILYSYYIHIIFILYSYYIQIIFIL